MVLLVLRSLILIVALFWAYALIMLNMYHEESAHIDIAPVDRVLDTALDVLSDNYLHFAYSRIGFIRVL